MLAKPSQKAPAKASRRSRWCDRKRIWRSCGRVARPVPATGARRNVPARPRVHRRHRRHRQSRPRDRLDRNRRAQRRRAEVYSYTNKEECETLVEYRHVTHADPLVAEAGASRSRVECARLSRRRSRGHPLRRVGKPMFLEVNPLGSASDAFRSADDRPRSACLRGVDPRHRRIGRHANFRSARARA